MTSRKELLKGRLKNVRAWLNTCLERLTPELLDWAPAEGMRTIAGQLVEIIAVEIPLVPRFETGKELTDEEVDAIVGDQHDLPNLLAKLTSVREETLRYLDGLTDAQLEEVAPCGSCWYGTFWKDDMPRAEHFLNIAEHEFYHVGQLISYLWANGSDPYQW